ncbi:MAG: hypothetical protein KGQ67_09865 [Betaproteobacteria bacterium]|nr:hypothetical protein [Betaproteobacteria bacterium]
MREGSGSSIPRRWRHLGGLLLAGLLLAWGGAALAHAPAERLDPEERKRLRHDLRRHASSARLMAESEPNLVRPPPESPPERGANEYGLAPPSPGASGSSAAPSAPPPEADRPAPTPGALRPSHPVHGRHGARRSEPEPGMTPLTPEERRQLRLQLLEERRRRQQDLSR